MDLEKILKLMKIQSKNAPVFKISRIANNEFKIAICAILSSRTRDEITLKVCKKLFKKVKNVEDLIEINEKELEKLIYPVGFYKVKTKILKKFALELKRKFNSKIPSKLEDLISLPGIGIKAAKVILSEAFKKPCIAVDTHVLRISNRLGIINTKDVNEANEILEKIIPKNLKTKFNKTFVAFGQTICKPKNPKCSICLLKGFCKYYKK
jgi:endonuclease-3